MNFGCVLLYNAWCFQVQFLLVQSLTTHIWVSLHSSISHRFWDRFCCPYWHWNASAVYIVRCRVSLPTLSVLHWPLWSYFISCIRVSSTTCHCLTSVSTRLSGEIFAHMRGPLKIRRFPTGGRLTLIHCVFPNDLPHGSSQSGLGRGWNPVTPSFSWWL